MANTNDYFIPSRVNGSAPDWADQIIGGGLTFRQWMREYGVRVPRCRSGDEGPVYEADDDC